MRLFTKLSIFCLLFASAAFGQVSVAPVCQLGKCQFFDSNGRPLASGRVYSYLGGTTTLSSTYKESTGTVQNTDPIVLDAGGYASVWLANHTYKFCTYNSLSVLQYPCQDNVTGYLGLLNLSNTWTLPQTFSNTVTFTLTDNQLIFGAPGAQTTLDFPPPASNITLHFPITADTMVGRATTDTLTNKTLTSPTISNPTITGIAKGVDTVLFRSTAPVTHTGTVTTDTIFSTTIPAGALGTNGKVRVTLVFAVLVFNTGASINVSLNGVSIGTVDNVAITALGVNNLAKATIEGGNTGATNTQRWDGLLIGNALATRQISLYTATAQDTTLALPLVVTVTNLNVADSQTFEYCVVEIL